MSDIDPVIDLEPSGSNITNNIPPRLSYTADEMAAVVAERDQLKALSETMNAIAIDKGGQLAESRAKCEKLNLQWLEAADERDQWHRVVTDVERVLRCAGTAESGAMSDLPNLVRDLVSVCNRVRAELAAAASREDTLTSQRDSYRESSFAWRDLVNRCEKHLGMDPFATCPLSTSVLEAIDAVIAERDRLLAERAATECEPYASLVARVRNLTAERDRLRAQLAAIAEDTCGPSCASQMKAANDELDRLRKCVDAMVCIVNRAAANDERDQARAAILSFGCGNGFDWNVIGKLDDQEKEIERLRAENDTLRTCFCIEPDETVISSTPGSILVDSKTGNRRRYMTATDEERDLHARLEAMKEQRDSLQAENLEWLRLVRGFLDSHEARPDPSEEDEWINDLDQMRLGRAAIHTPKPVVDDLIADRDRMVSALHNSRNLFTTMSTAYVIRIEQLEKFVSSIRLADSAALVTDTASLVRAAIKWLDEQEKA